MIMSNEVQTLIHQYQQNPCRLHACAIWKTLKNIENYNLIINSNTIKIWNGTQVHLDFHGDDPKKVSPYDFHQLKLLILHDNQMDDAFLDDFNSHQVYFRLQYDIGHPREIIHEYHIQEVDTQNELEDVADFISQCYEDMKPTADYFYRCTQESVFGGHLWIWVIDPATKKKTGLGIAEYDANTGEGSLDWIQVLPDEQSKGIGKVVVTELTNRLQTQAKFITVAGKSKYAEKLYRKCGFTGNDVWNVLTK